MTREQMNEFLDGREMPSDGDIREMSALMTGNLTDMDKLFIRVIDKLILDFKWLAEEVEKLKLRQHNTETEVRGVHGKISNIEHSLSVFRDCINEQADQLDRLNKEVFDEDPKEKEE